MLLAHPLLCSLSWFGGWEGGRLYSSNRAGSAGKPPFRKCILIPDYLLQSQVSVGVQYCRWASYLKALKRKLLYPLRKHKPRIKLIRRGGGKEEGNLIGMHLPE